MSKVKYADPLQLLRETIIANDKIVLEGDNLVFPQNLKLPCKTEVAWSPPHSQKKYFLGDLWLLLHCHVNNENYYKAFQEYPGFQFVSIGQ